MMPGNSSFFSLRISAEIRSVRRSFSPPSSSIPRPTLHLNMQSSDFAAVQSAPQQAALAIVLKLRLQPAYAAHGDRCNRVARGGLSASRAGCCRLFQELPAAAPVDTPVALRVGRPEGGNIGMRCSTMPNSAFHATPEAVDWKGYGYEENSLPPSASASCSPALPLQPPPGRTCRPALTPPKWCWTRSWAPRTAAFP